jgi:predicted ArsR family transcriptional regulator
MNPKANPRIDRILRELQRSGSVSIDSLCSMLNISIATARRDLQELEEQACCGARTAERSPSSLFFTKLSGMTRRSRNKSAATPRRSGALRWPPRTL